MLKSTFHTHSRFDDGQGELETYIHSALSKDFKVFGFSAHAPVLFDSNWNMKHEDFNEYIKITKSLRDKYKGLIEIYTGLEVDYYKGCTDFRKKGIDYTIGSVHMLKNESTGTFMALDGNAGEFEYTLKEGFDGNIQKLFEAYYGLIREMVLRMPPNIIGHLDVIKKNNPHNLYFDEKDIKYRNEVLKTLKVIADSNSIVEVNTGGIARGCLKETYPSRWILEACYDMDIPVMVNSDAHHPEHVDFYYSEAYELLKSIGFRHQRILYDGKWCDVDFL